jgi:hypothetical protein
VSGLYPKGVLGSRRKCLRFYAIPQR